MRSTLAVLLLAASTPAFAADLPKLKVSDNKRFLVTADGKPFFYLGDTAWELFHRLNREDAEHYLKDRAAKKYTVIQAVVLAELDGLKTPNANGHLPLVDNDPLKPNEDYFKHVDWIVDRANALGLYVGMLPTWGDKVGPKGKNPAAGPEILTAANAKAYGEWLGKRYKDKGIIWVLGGDRNPDNPERIAAWKAMAAGLRAGDGGAHLITFHPGGGHSSAEWFHEEPWLDFNMWQTGHDTNRPVWNLVGKDYGMTPTKPVVDGEPLYEDHPIGFNAKERGVSNAADIRRSAYWGIFAGGCGYTYGNHAVWQMFDKGRQPINNPLMPWREAIKAPGAGQVQYLRALVESRPYLTRIPDQALIASDASAGTKRVQATRDEKGSYAFVYLPASRPVTVNTGKLAGAELAAWWFDPRTGKATPAIQAKKEPTATFTPPDLGENTDWVLVLDAAAAKFPPPGQVGK